MNFPWAVLTFALVLICRSQAKELECGSDFSERALGTFAVERIIEKVQARMRYGFPLLNIAPLSPLKLNDRNNSINLSFMQFNATLNNVLIAGIDRFRINYVKFSLKDRSMNFSLTFTDLQSNGSYAGVGNFIKYLPIQGRGNYNFTALNLTTNLVTFVTFQRLRMQIVNFTATTTMSRFKSNVTGVSGDKRWATRSINKLLNRLIEVATPPILDLNQRLFNYAINNIVVPRINKILTMYAVSTSSTTKHGSGNGKDDRRLFLSELDDATILKYQKQHPIKYPNEQRILKMLFDEKFYDAKVR